MTRAPSTDRESIAATASASLPYVVKVKTPGALVAKAVEIWSTAGAGPARPTGMSCGDGLLIAGAINPIKVTRASSPATTGATYVSAACLRSISHLIAGIHHV